LFIWQFRCLRLGRLRMPCSASSMHGRALSLGCNQITFNRGMSVRLFMCVKQPIDFRPVAHSLRSAFAGCLSIWHLKNIEESSARTLELCGQRTKWVHFIKAPMVRDHHFLGRCRNYSTAKEIVKSRTPRWLVRTVVFEIRSLLVSLNWTYQSCVECSARRGTTRRKYNRNSKHYC
jgi:hypothetical protein